MPQSVTTNCSVIILYILVCSLKYGIRRQILRGSGKTLDPHKWLILNKWNVFYAQNTHTPNCFVFLVFWFFWFAKHSAFLFMQASFQGWLLTIPGPFPAVFLACSPEASAGTDTLFPAETLKTGAPSPSHLRPSFWIKSLRVHLPRTVGTVPKVTWPSQKTKHLASISNNSTGLTICHRSEGGEMGTVVFQFLKSEAAWAKMARSEQVKAEVLRRGS